MRLAVHLVVMNFLYVRNVSLIPKIVNAIWKTRIFKFMHYCLSDNILMHVLWKEKLDKYAYYIHKQ